nr:hypothetical protein [Sphingomonas jejuensis]
MEQLLLAIGSGAGMATQAEIAGRLSMRVSTLPLSAETVQRLAYAPAPDCVSLVVQPDDDEYLDEVLREIDVLVREHQTGGVISFPRSMIDRVTGAMTSPAAILLCEPSSAEQASAIALSSSRSSGGFNDMVAEGEAERLQRLTEEVGRIARALAELSRTGGTERVGGAVPVKPAMIGDDRVDAATIRTAIRLRRLREQFFDSSLFADPAWDMLLDLMAARVEGRQVAVSSLCIAAAVPPTTALRWIGTMTEAGLLIRRSDPVDRRRIFMVLSNEAAAGVAGYFEAARRIGGSMQAA